MSEIRGLALLTLFSCALSRQGWENIQPAASCEDQTQALQGLLARNIPQHFQAYFKLRVADDCHSGSFQPSSGYVHIVSKPLGNGENEVVITGDSGVSTAFGLNHYLKYFTNSQITWDERRVMLEHPLPEADLVITSLDKFRYNLS